MHTSPALTVITCGVKFAPPEYLTWGEKFAAAEYGTLSPKEINTIATTAQAHQNLQNNAKMNS